MSARRKPPPQAEEEARTLERSDRMCLFYDLCVPALVDKVLGRGVFLVGSLGQNATIDAYKRPVLLGGTDACVASLACPLLRARPHMRVQLESLRVRLNQLSGSMPAAARWAPHVHAIVSASDASMQKWAIVGWAEEDPRAHAAQVCALYAALVGIRDTPGPQGLAEWGLPPSLRRIRFYEIWKLNREYDHAPHTPADERRRLYEWFSFIVQLDGDAFWARVDRYIAFVENEWLGGEVRRSPPLRDAMLQYLVALPHFPLAAEVRALVS
jgi:hypothetical protein